MRRHIAALKESLEKCIAKIVVVQDQGPVNAGKIRFAEVDV